MLPDDVVVRETAQIVVDAISDLQAKILKEIKMEIFGKWVIGVRNVSKAGQKLFPRYFAMFSFYLDVSKLAE